MTNATKPSDTTNKHDTRVIATPWLLGFVGALAILIPVLLLLTSASSSDVDQQQSISHYYYTPLRDVLMGSLFAVSVFLFSYTGYPHKPGEWLSDRTLSLVAGLGMICVVVFPTPALEGHPAFIPSLSIFFAPDSCAVTWLHRIGAIAFMSSLGYMSLVNFCRAKYAEKYRSQGLPMQRRTENWVYRVCGIIMLGCVGLMILQSLVLPSDQMFFTNATFWFESIGIFFFGLSWLTKTKLLGCVFPTPE